MGTPGRLEAGTMYAPVGRSVGEQVRRWVETGKGGPAQPLSPGPLPPFPSSPTHLLTYSPTHLLTYSPTHLLTYAPTHLRTYSPTRSRASRPAALHPLVPLQHHCRVDPAKAEAVAQRILHVRAAAFAG